MSAHPESPALSAEPLTDFSQCHVGITSRLKALAELPALLEPAAQARHLAAESLTFFDEVIEEHHGSEERELFPAVIASAVRGDERDRVQALADRLVAEHRQIEAQWARLVPGLKEAAKGRDSTLDSAAVQKLVDAYLAHAAFEEREFLPLSQTILSRDNNHMAALAIALHMRHTVPAALARWGHRV
jgi:cell division protein FtsL